jgi:predicted nucleotidyltransferase
MPSVIRKESFNSVRVFWLNEAQLRKRLKRAAKELAADCPEVLEVFLFGSLATGNATAASDVDILVFVKESDSRFVDRTLRYRPFFEGLGLCVDVFAYTRLEQESGAIPFAVDASRRGERLFHRSEPK